VPESANAAGDIASLTPQHTLLSTGGHTTVTTGHDTNLLAQRHQAWAVKGGISLFTRGEAKNPQRAVQDVGIKLHAASGNVRTEAQSGPFTLTAQQGIDLQSTAAHIEITAPNRILLNGGGGYVKIEGGNIEIGTSGKASFKAAMKELTGGAASSQAALNLIPPGALALGPKAAPDVQFQFLDDDGNPLGDRPYVLVKEDGSTIDGQTDQEGMTVVYKSSSPEKCFARLLNDMEAEA
jgi:type VI secretion system secreted protein VgrG